MVKITKYREDGLFTARKTKGRINKEFAWTDQNGLECSKFSNTSSYI